MNIYSSNIVFRRPIKDCCEQLWHEYKKGHSQTSKTIAQGLFHRKEPESKPEQSSHYFTKEGNKNITSVYATFSWIQNHLTIWMESTISSKRSKTTISLRNAAIICWHELFAQKNMLEKIVWNMWMWKKYQQNPIDHKEKRKQIHNQKHFTKLPWSRHSAVGQRAKWMKKKCPAETQEHKKTTPNTSNWKHQKRKPSKNNQQPNWSRDPTSIKDILFRSPHTLSQISQAALGLILETGPVSLLTQLPWFLLPPLSFSDMSAGRSCKAWYFWTFGPRLVEGVVTMVLCRTACSVCMKPIGHHRHVHWLAERHMLSATTMPAAEYSGLKGCQVLHQCYLLPACKKLSLLPSTNGLLTGTSWNWHNLTNMFLMNVLSNSQTWIRATKFTYVYS